MRLKLTLLVMGGVLLLVTGFFPGSLPFNPGARYSDAVTSHWGAALFLRTAVIEQQQFPLWRETLMAGAPFAANPLNKTAYPLQWLALLLPAALHLDLMIGLHLVIAGAGMWRWARAQGLRRESAALSAVAFALSPRVIGHTGAGHLDLLYALAWLPWLMDAVLRFVSWGVLDSPSTPNPFSHAGGEKGNKPGLSPSHASEERDDPTKLSRVRGRDQLQPERILPETRQSGVLRQVLQIALFAALVLLADVRLSLFALSLAAAYGLYEIAGAKQWRRLAWLLPAALLFSLLTASVTLPLLGWSPYLSRAGLTIEEAGMFSLEPAHLIGLVLPPHSGNIETLTYVGLPVLALAVLALITAPRRRRFWLLALLLAVWFALGQNGWLWSALARLIPALLWFRVPSRAWFVVALALALLAGFGFDWLLDRTHRRTPQRWRLYALIGLVAALAGGMFAITGLPIPDAAGWSVIVGGGGLSLIVLLVFFRAVSIERAAILVVFVVFADLLITGRSWLEWRGEQDWLTPYQPLAAALIEDNAARVYSPDYSLPQQAAEAYGLRLFGGVDPFQIDGVAQAVAQAGGIERVGYSVVVPPLTGIMGDDPATANREAVPDTEMLAAWDVSHVIAARPLEQARLSLLDEIVGQDGGVFVYRNLDYAAPPADDTLPRWGAAADLPSSATISYLNQLTAASAALAAVALVLSLLALLKTTR